MATEDQVTRSNRVLRESNTTIPHASQVEIPGIFADQNFTVAPSLKALLDKERAENKFLLETGLDLNDL